MEEDEISFVEGPGDTPQATYESQLAALQVYLNSLPYECESAEEMHQALENIVSKIYISAKARNWAVLVTWDGMLLCWLLMAYPLPKSTRAKLAALYYELTVLPGVDVRSTRNWADMLSRLLSTKSGAYRKLEATDLELPWKPLWRVLQKELWPKSSMADPQRNLVNILLYIADLSKRYYPVQAVHEMLDEFLPMFTQENMLTMIPVITSFLPPTETSVYLPALFRIWEAFNSSVLDDRMLELCGDLAEEHVAGQAGEAGEHAAEWKDVGIWTQWQWDFLSGKALSSMNAPIGMMKHAGGNTTQHADLGDPQKSKIKKSINRMNAIAKLFVFSMSVDGEIRQDTPATSNSRGPLPKQSGFAAGSKALDTLERLINSIETFFHPSNLGNWTPGLNLLLKRLSAEFIARYEEQILPDSKVPESQRLTPQIRRHFVKLLSTPALLAMFSKDSNSANYAHGALRTLATIEPSIIMPELLERAYGGLEVVNETHRTTAVLSSLSVITRPLLTESVWLGGQKHLVPLLELCLPGIDLNDPSKTLCATMFIVSATQRVKLGDLSASRGGATFDDGMEIDEDVDHIPDASEYGDTIVLDREEERSLVRDSTASFADWVVTLFRRVFSLYENLPEEGGKKNTTGGKSEEAVLKSIKDMLDVVCQHLSDPLFDLVLKLVYEYGTTNAKSNAVRAFGQLIGCLSKAQPEKTISKFLPFCIAQIEEEIKHGASSVRTTSTHAAVPSDTTLHWNLAILRGCLGYGGSAMLNHKAEIIRVLGLLVEKTKSERGYTSTGRLITRILNTLNSVYPLGARFANTDEWNDPKFNSNHNLYWGKMYEAKDVIIDWHVPSAEDINFTFEILEHIYKPALDIVESLLADTTRWDNVARNDFCRYLHACRSILIGIANFIKLPPATVVNPCLIDSFEVADTILSPLDMKCGFPLTNPEDPRYQKVLKHRERFAQVTLRAASLLRQNTGGEDHIDALITVTRAIDTYLLVYGANRADYDALQKNYRQTRDQSKSWAKQKENYRNNHVKRAQLYHMARIYMHSLYRSRSEMDDNLIKELVELSLSPYTRIRRQAQSSVHSVTGHYLRSTRLVLPMLFQAITKGNDRDRMKGALYMLWNKGLAAYALSDQDFHQTYLVSVLECQHEEKPSIQKVISNIATDCLGYVNEESILTDAFSIDTPRVVRALEDLKTEFSDSFVNQKLLEEVVVKTEIRHANRDTVWRNTVAAVLEIAVRPTTHWRYVQMATKCLSQLIRRDIAMPPAVAVFFAEQALNPQPTIRSQAQKALSRLLYCVKIRTHSRSEEDYWFEEWKNPLKKRLPVENPEKFLELLHKPVSESGYFVDKLQTGFLAWTKTVDVYGLPDNSPQVPWDASSSEMLQAMRSVFSREDFISQLANLWSQESGKGTSSINVRPENLTFIKYIAKIFGYEYLTKLLQVSDALILNSDKFKQRAGAEILAGILRGSKHWPKKGSEGLWSWTGARLDAIYSQMKPDTVLFWQQIIHDQIEDRDPRRNQVLVDWILHLPLEFAGESAFQMAKSVTLLSFFVDAVGVFFNPYAPKYVDLFFANADTDYAEIRQHICHGLYLIMRNLWQPGYSSTHAFLVACRDSSDPLQVRQAIYQKNVAVIVEKFSQWKEERLPPPRVSQSQYDKVGLTILLWIWISAHGAPAHLVIPYIIPLMPEILHMAELNDSPDIQAYSSGVLYILSALTPLSDYVDPLLDRFVETIENSTSRRSRLHGLPALVIFFYRNLLALSPDHVSKVMRVLLDCLSHENVEVREMASKVLSGVIRTSQRQNIIPLKKRFVALAKKTILPSRQDPEYATALRTLHSAILGLCALLGSFPYSIEPWIPPLTEVLAPHATDPPPISTTIRNCASEFKKTHQETWHKDQLAFDEDQLQSLSTMVVGTSYYA